MNIAYPVLLLFSSAHRATCPAGQRRDEPALVQVEQAWVRASEHHDGAALACILADEFEEADADGSLITRSALLAGATKPGNSHSELTDMNVHIYGDVATVRGIGVNSKNGQPVGRTRFTDVFVYRDGRWQCVAGHSSRFPPRR